MLAAVLIIDDHPVFAEGLTAALNSFRIATEVLTADSIQAGVEIMRKRVIELVLLDNYLGDDVGSQHIQALRAIRPSTRIVMISAGQHARDVYVALQRGADGYLGKSAKRDEFLLAVACVMRGESYLPEWFAAQEAAPYVGADPPLTERQRYVLDLMAQGLCNKRIARALGVSENTVKAHVAAIFRALDVHSRTHATHVAHELGLIRNVAS
jgi:two-component system, NarL family, nitrate/nitrite response regulator NarL